MFSIVYSVTAGHSVYLHALTDMKGVELHSVARTHALFYLTHSQDLQLLTDMASIICSMRVCFDVNVGQCELSTQK